MIVVGGYYHEVCSSPQADERFGSGGRAAVAIAASGTEVDWHYYCPDDLQAGASLSFGTPLIRHHPQRSDGLVRFDYFHPLSSPVFSPAQPSQQTPIQVEGRSVLRFGFMEGDAVVRGSRVVFDPQSPNAPSFYTENGSAADQLAVVLNAREIKALTGVDDEKEAVSRLSSKDAAGIILVKDGPHGCRVYVEGELTGSVPPYRTQNVYKIGSGDVFSASFAYHWADQRASPLNAADAASRCAARYCDRRIPSVVLDSATAALDSAQFKNIGASVYVAGPFFTMSELWLVEETCRALRELGVRYFSPFHEAGLLGDYRDSEDHRGKVRETVAQDLAGLSEASAVFAILDGCDPGTVFEIGWATKQGIPVVAFSQNPKASDQTMLRGSENCSVTNDFSSAVYRVAWEAWSG